MSLEQDHWVFAMTTLLLLPLGLLLAVIWGHRGVPFVREGAWPVAMAVGAFIASWTALMVGMALGQRPSLVLLAVPAVLGLACGAVVAFYVHLQETRRPKAGAGATVP